MALLKSVQALSCHQLGDYSQVVPTNFQNPLQQPWDHPQDAFKSDPRDMVTSGQPSQILSWSVTHPAAGASAGKCEGELQELSIFWTLADKMSSGLLLPEDTHPLFLIDPSPPPGAGRDDTAPQGHRTQWCRLHKWNGRNEEQQMSHLLTRSQVQPSSSPHPHKAHQFEGCPSHPLEARTFPQLLPALLLSSVGHHRTWAFMILLFQSKKPWLL